jgi:CMP-N,N'-diacetyllegionaminic acid synthase
MKHKILAVIPARGGSKGLPKKNVRPLLGKPLLAWTIEAAKQSKHITTVFVSTDDAEIAKVSEEYGVIVPVLRPAELSTDKSSIYDAINFILDSFEEKGQFFDIIILLEPTSPLRKAGDIDRAIEDFITNYDAADSLISIGEVQLEHPYSMKLVENGRVKPFITTQETYNQRQEMPVFYFPYGVIYLSKVKTLRESGTFYQKNTLPYIIERWQNYEINDIFDFYCVESVLKQQLHEVME